MVEAFKWLGVNEPLTKAVNQNYIGEETLLAANAKLVSAQTQIALPHAGVTAKWPRPTAFTLWCSWRR